MSDAGVAMECDEAQERAEEPQQEEPQDISPEPQEEAQEEEEAQDEDQEVQEEEPQEEDLQEDQEEPQDTSAPASVAADNEDAEPQSNGAGEDTLAVISSARGRRGRKANDDGAEKEKLAKRPRWGDKAFDEITMADVETLVRKVNTLEKKVEANADAAIQLQELQKEKKGLEKELVDVGADEVARVKASISKQLLAQMHYVFAWNADLKGDGFDISAFVPNVSPKMLKALGGSVEKPTPRMAARYFETALMRHVKPTGKKNEKPAGSALVLGSTLTLKYIKTTSELQVITTYKFGCPEKKEKTKAANAKKKARGGEAIRDGEEGEEGEEDAAEDEADDADAPAKVGEDARREDEQIALGGQ